MFDWLLFVGRIVGNVYGVFVYGSRGFIWVVLVAELLVSELEGESLVLEGKLADAFSLLRFACRVARCGLC